MITEETAMRRVLLVLVVAIVAAFYWSSLKGRLTVIRDSAPHETGASGPRVRLDETGKFASRDPGRPAASPTDPQTPAVLGRALEDNARRSLEAMTRSYDAPRPGPRGAGDATSTPAGPERTWRPDGSASVVDSDRPAGGHFGPTRQDWGLPLSREATASDNQRRFEAFLVEQSRSEARALEVDLQAERKRAADLAGKLAEAERKAASAETDQDRLEALTEDLATTRARLADASTAGAEALQRAEAARRDGDAAVQNERTRVAALSAMLTEAERKLAARTEAPRQETGPELTGRGTSGADVPTALGRDLAASSAALPSEVPAHVVLRYARGSEPARQRAEGLGFALKGQGLDVADPVENPTAATLNSVTFFYKRDAGNAKRIAGILAAAEPIQGRLPAGGSVPRPGTIEVTIID